MESPHQNKRFEEEFMKKVSDFTKGQMVVCLNKKGDGIPFLGRVAMTDANYVFVDTSGFEKIADAASECAYYPDELLKVEEI